ncbi:phosphatidylinositol-specific phospholipase C/glycerophosphodiester phosphodiesterase family protein [Aeoliella sp.]|uniref:phosphatidylinositol-specific phospholipase C/glycerophosphodiester phosphodiesterase family protein n=1 Tax=Aeoliella sp. TaxID=2795800 RepID=UPI003CCB93EC
MLVLWGGSDVVETKHAMWLIVVLLASASSLAADETRKPTPLRHAHAHNDYYHQRPLLDALDHGFNSVEADIYLVDGQLLVGHDRHELRPERTLQNLYLEPLAKRVKQQGGYVHQAKVPFYLFIDVKERASATREVLGKQLLEYKSMVGRRTGEDAPPAVTIVLSGAEPRRGIMIDGVRLAGADGRLSELESNASAAAMPVVSDHWGKHFGEDELTSAQLRRLREVTGEAHESGRIVRFWATPDSERLWGTLLDNGVDLINTDDLERLSKYLQNRASESQSGSDDKSKPD